MTSLRLYSQCYVSAIMSLSWQVIPLDCFEGQSSDGRFVPVVPGGRSIPLTFHNRHDYVERAINYRLHEMELQVILLSSLKHHCVHHAVGKTKSVTLNFNLFNKLWHPENISFFGRPNSCLRPEIFMGFVNNILYYN